jgi:cytochrome c oxidase assembly protein subunit 11
MSLHDKQKQVGAARNLRVVFACLFVVAGMGGLAYASVPLYRLFCQVTGYGGTTQRAENAHGIEIVDHEVAVRFDANTAPGLDWKFYPEQRSVKLKLGEIVKVNYISENNTDAPVTGTATFNITPQALGAYFNKMECFCFTETRLAPGEKLVMPVVFFIDPDILNSEEADGVSTLTLSYTFFPAGRDEKPETANSEKLNKQTSGG